MALGQNAQATFLAVVRGDASQAVTEFKRMGSAIQKSTSGASQDVGKFKQLWSKAGSEIKANAGLIAASAGAAIGAFAVGAVVQFEKLGLAVGKLHDATGLTTQSASRWIEVSGDLGISTDQLTGLITKMDKALGSTPEYFAKYGIGVVYAKDGTIDMNETLLSAIDRLSAMTDPTQKAAVAAKLFGKSYADSAELIFGGSGKIRNALESVDKSKVFDPKAVEQARQFRDALKDLGDKGEELALKLGRDLIPTATKLVALLTTLVSVGEKVGPVIAKITPAGSQSGGDPFGYKGIGKLADAYLRTKDAADRGLTSSTKLFRAFDDGRISAEEMQKAIDANTSSLTLSHGQILAVTDATDRLAREHQLAADAEANQSAETRAHTKLITDQALALRGLQDSAYAAIKAMNQQTTDGLDVSDAYENMKQKIQDAKKAKDDPKTAANEKIQATNDAARAILAAQDAVKKKAEDFATQQGRATADGVTGIRLQIQALKDMEKKYPELKGFIEDYIKTLNSIPGAKNTTVTVTGITPGGDFIGYYGVSKQNGQLVGKKAGGGAAHGLTLVGERGPELVDFGSHSGNVHTAGQTQLMLRSAMRNSSSGVQAANVYNITMEVAPGYDRMRLSADLYDLLEYGYKGGQRMSGMAA